MEGKLPGGLWVGEDCLNKYNFNLKLFNNILLYFKKLYILFTIYHCSINNLNYNATINRVK